MKQIESTKAPITHESMPVLNNVLGAVLGNNQSVPMTRRYPNLPNKVLKRDSEIIKKIISAWDLENDADKVLSIYLKENKNLSDFRYWEVLRTVWILCGSIENADLFRKLMQSSRKQKYYFSTPEEAKFLRELPEEIEVYRATNKFNDNGLSWTLSKEYSEWYKTAYQKDKVISKIINKKQIFAYIERNLESEVVIL
jgi:hypothetical protein